MNLEINHFYRMRRYWSSSMVFQDEAPIPFHDEAPIPFHRRRRGEELKEGFETVVGLVMKTLMGVLGLYRETSNLTLVSP